jgi:flagellar hook-associated protein 3 FlgL
MRISTFLSHQLGVSAMGDQQTKMSKTQLQISTGLRLQTPSDDPTGSVQSLVLKSTLSINEQFQSTIGTLQTRLQSEDSNLGAADSVLQRVRQLTIQAANGSLSPSDRKALAQEVRQLTSQFLGITNLRNDSGEYMFSGQRTDTPAYRQDGTLIPPGYSYDGDARQRVLQISSLRTVADGDTGYDLFENVASSSLSATAGLGPAQGTLAGTKNLDNGINLASADQFLLTVDEGTQVTVNLAAASYADAKSVVVAVNNAINAAYSSLTPAVIPAPVLAKISDGKLQLVSSTQGTVSSVQVNSVAPPGVPGDFMDLVGMSDGQKAVGSDPARQNVLDTLASLADALEGTFTPVHGRIQGRADLRDGVDFSTALQPLTFALSLDGKTPVTVTLQNLDYPDSAALTGALNAAINTAFATNPPPVTAQVKSGRLEFVSTTTGKSSSVQILNDPAVVPVPTGVDNFLTMTGFTDHQIRSGGDLGADPLGDALKSSLNDLDSSLQQILGIRTNIGARLNSLDLQTGVNAKFILDTQSNLSQIEDLDYAQAISEFSLQQLALQAAQQAYAKVQSLSLFNYFR